MINRQNLRQYANRPQGLISVFSKMKTYIIRLPKFIFLTECFYYKN
jgi:hypothetical protein